MMGVDRVGRDVAAGALAAFLRGESGRGDLVAAFQRIEEELKPRPRLERDAFLNITLTLVTSEGSQGPAISQAEISKDYWKRLCRRLAFLKSDLEKREWSVDTEKILDMHGPRMIRFMRWSSLGVLAACGVAYFTSWWVIPGASAFSLAMSQRVFQEWILLTSDEKRRLKEQRAFNPFYDQEDWLVHRHLLDSFDLPDYDPARFGLPADGGRRSKFIDGPIQFLTSVAIAFIISPMIIVALLFYPFFLVGAWLPRRRDGGGD
ncbi:MAG: hypothetical protein KDA68_13800 [Planctomycetaceae bacterium]|nr:hypothetical protein [Planctomycetaceae bacterium]